jgi:hypothetical protein
MADLTILSWNLQGQNPYTSVELRSAITECKPDFVFVCEVGESARTNFIANLWTEDDLLLRKVEENAGKLSKEENNNVERLRAVLDFKIKTNAFGPILTPIEKPPKLVAAPNASTYTTHLDSHYGWDASMLNAETVVNDGVTALRGRLGALGTNIDRGTTIQSGAARLHPLHQLYPNSEFFEMKTQVNRNYLVLWRGAFRCEGERALVLPGKRPLVVFSGPAHLMFIHAIAAEGAAKKQLREAATFVRTAAHKHKHPVILTGDLNCKADVLAVDTQLEEEIRKGLSILSTGKPTQYSGGELDYALACGIKTTSTIQLLPTHASDHRAILLSLDF